MEQNIVGNEQENNSITIGGAEIDKDIVVLLSTIGFFAGVQNLVTAQGNPQAMDNDSFNGFVDMLCQNHLANMMNNPLFIENLNKSLEEKRKEQ